ncbi:hypothetical protein D3C80_862840 [compost metagenome]
MRLCGVAAATVDGDLEHVGRRHDAALADGEIADGKPRLVMHAVDFVDAELVDETVFNHRQRSSTALFGRLEDHRNRSLEVARLGQILGSPEKHGRVAVMAA